MLRFYASLLFAWGLLTLPATAQQIDQPSVGANYAQFAFYRLSDGHTETFAHDSWDLAFQVSSMGVGIHLNEATPLSFGAPASPLALYVGDDARNPSWSNTDTTSMTRLYNSEVSWGTGAFNVPVNPQNPFDMGWGNYDMTTHGVNGTRIFFLQQRDGTWRKLQIVSLLGGVYTVRHAQLDGTQEQTFTLDKTQYNGHNIVFYSLADQQVINVSPDWDLVFGRYVTPLDDGTGGILDYLVTGTLQNADVQVAQADNIDPLTVDHLNYTAAYSDTLTTIGHDWKYFDFTTGWAVTPNQAYFVKVANDSIYKLVFLDFEGSSTGVTTLERTFITTTSIAPQPQAAVHDLQLFPNPVVDHVNLAFEAPKATDYTLTLSNAAGQIAWTRRASAHTGFNVWRLAFAESPGLYYLTIRDEAGHTTTAPLLVR